MFNLMKNLRKCITCNFLFPRTGKKIELGLSNADYYNNKKDYLTYR